jgi:hypothetical protein
MQSHARERRRHPHERDMTFLLRRRPGDYPLQQRSDPMGYDARPPPAVSAATCAGRAHFLRTSSKADMGNSIDFGSTLERRERSIASLAASTSSSIDETRNVFDRELARLEPDAKVRTHLEAVVASNVRTILRRKHA